MGLFCRGTLLAFALGLVWTLPVFGEADFARPVEHEIKALPTPEIQWIDAKGELLPLKWPIQSRWIWEPVEKTPIQVPVLRTWLQIPANRTLLKFESAQVQPIRGAKDSPFPNTAGEVLSIDSRTPIATLNLTLKRPDGETEQVGLALKIPVEKPLDWEDPECASLGISNIKKAGNAKFLYGAAVCRQTEKTFDLYIVHSKDSDWMGTTIRGQRGSGPGWVLFRFKKPKVPPKKPIMLGTFKVVERGRSLINENQVRFRKTAPDSRVRFSMGIGPTYTQYTEAPLDVSVSEFSLTGKINFAYFLSKKFDLSANSFFTLMPLSVSPAGSDAFRILGINGRVGYKLPFNFLKSDWSISAGWYYWSMVVPGATYGISSLSGPQAFLFFRKVFASQRSFYWYFKFAPISDRFESPNMSRREIAFGTGYTLTRPGARPWTITLDYADMKFSATETPNQITMGSYSLGVQTSL